MVRELCSQLRTFILDRFATHVARRVLCLLCGADVLPAGSRGPDSEAGQAAGGGAGGSAGGGAAASKAGATLAARMSRDKGSSFMQAGVRFPEMLEVRIRCCVWA
jgi:hypothetical protein